jgi:multidrug efflux pump subunit AcrB
VRLPDSSASIRQAAAHADSTADGKPIPVSEVASMTRANGQGELRRENLRPMAVVSGRLEGRDLGSAVGEIQANLDKLTLPIGYTYEIGGQYQAQAQAFRELLMVFALAVVLSSPSWSSSSGRGCRRSSSCSRRRSRLAARSAAALHRHGPEHLVGHGHHPARRPCGEERIMLLDFSEKLHEEGEPSSPAIAHAGRIRLRPILMTTFCTLFGLLPLAFGLGAGAELQRPLALAVIGGLALSTPVTLLAVPGLYAAIKTYGHSSQNL